MRRWPGIAVLIAGLGVPPAANALVVYSAKGKIRALTDIALADPSGGLHRFDVRFVRADYETAYSTGFTTLPSDLPSNLNEHALSAVLDGLNVQGAAGVEFAGGDTRFFRPLLATGLQAGTACGACLQSGWGSFTPTLDSWTYGGTKWVLTNASTRWPAGAVGPTVTWAVFAPAAVVPVPPSALLFGGGLLLLAIGRRVSGGG